MDQVWIPRGRAWTLLRGSIKTMLPSEYDVAIASNGHSIARRHLLHSGLSSYILSWGWLPQIFFGENECGHFKNSSEEEGAECLGSLNFPPAFSGLFCFAWINTASEIPADLFYGMYFLYCPGRTESHNWTQYPGVWPTVSVEQLMPTFHGALRKDHCKNYNCCWHH